MPNGYMVVNSRFKPFSYEEMLRPIALIQMNTMPRKLPMVN